MISIIVSYINCCVLIFLYFHQKWIPSRQNMVPAGSEEPESGNKNSIGYKNVNPVNPVNPVNL